MLYLVLEGGGSATTVELLEDYYLTSSDYLKFRALFFQELADLSPSLCFSCKSHYLHSHLIYVKHVLSFSLLQNYEDFSIYAILYADILLHLCIINYCI